MCRMMLCVLTFTHHVLYVLLVSLRRLTPLTLPVAPITTVRPTAIHAANREASGLAVGLAFSFLLKQIYLVSYSSSLSD